MIKIKIHRGTHQIGGCATEIECNGERILIDLGANLPGMDENAHISDQELLDSVFGKDRSKKYNAVLFSHYHGDHYGLYKGIPDDIPLYIGKTAKGILKIVTSYIDRNEEIKGSSIINCMKTYEDKKTIEELQQMEITPISVDHSALDAYMFLIKAEGKKILFTGDFRDHGIANNKGQLWETIEDVGKVDVLITEGTMLSRTMETKLNIVHTEKELGKKAGEFFSKKKYNFVLVSSTNLDSIMEFYHNTPADKWFICDHYQAKLIMCAVENKHNYYEEYQGKHEPEGHFPGYAKHIILTSEGEEGERKIRVRMMLNNKGKELKKYKHLPLYFEYKEMNDSTLENGFVMLVRPNRFREKNGLNLFEKVVDKYTTEYNDETNMIYSMWQGYLKGDSEDKDITRLVGDQKELIHLHTSGHAYVETIAKLIDKVKPEIIIPMHTEMADSFKDFEEFAEQSKKVKVLQDNQEFFI